MKINAGSIFGLTVAATGLLFILWSITERSAPPPEGSETPVVAATSNIWYVILGAGIIFSGLLIALVSQGLKRSPPAEIGSTKEDPDGSERKPLG